MRDHLLKEQEPLNMLCKLEYLYMLCKQHQFLSKLHSLEKPSSIPRCKSGIEMCLLHFEQNNNVSISKVFQDKSTEIQQHKHCCNHLNWRYFRHRMFRLHSILHFRMSKHKIQLLLHCSYNQLRQYKLLSIRQNQLYQHHHRPQILSIIHHRKQGCKQLDKSNQFQLCMQMNSHHHQLYYDHHMPLFQL